MEWIASDAPAFTRHLELVTGMLRARRQELYVGARPESATSALPRRANALRELRLGPERAAQMFAPNLAEFRTQPAIRAQACEAELDLLAESLALRAAGRAGAPATRALRQLAIEA